MTDNRGAARSGDLSRQANRGPTVDKHEYRNLQAQPDEVHVGGCWICGGEADEQYHVSFDYVSPPVGSYPSCGMPVHATCLYRLIVRTYEARQNRIYRRKARLEVGGKR